MTAARLRAFVRARVRRDGAAYTRGEAAKLAEAIGKPSSWISEYTDPEAPIGKRRHADIDTAAAICAYFRVSLADFIVDAEPTAAPAQTPAQAEAEIIEAAWPYVPAELRQHYRALILAAAAANRPRSGTAGSPASPLVGPETSVRRRKTAR